MHGIPPAERPRDSSISTGSRRRSGFRSHDEVAGLRCGSSSPVRSRACKAVDAAIKSHLQNWSFERLKRVDLAVLRLGAYSLLYQRDIPAQITIDEAIEIVKEYGSEDSYRFVNGVLDGIWKTESSKG